jgi:hypothetical protein
MPQRTSKENRHFHYYRIDEDGNGRTTQWVDKKTKSKHFHRITKFAVEPGGRDEHTHELRGDLKDAMKDDVRQDGSKRKARGMRLAQKDSELEAREIEREVRKKRRGDNRQQPKRKFNDLVNEVKGKGY